MKSRRHAKAVGVLFLSLMYPVAALAETWGESIRVDLEHLSGFAGADTSKVHEAADVVERVLNSEEFHQAILAFTYNGKPQFANNDGLTNAQIYEKIMNARETYTQADDHVAGMDLNLYTPPWYKRWSVVGYGYPGQPEIYMNSYYFHSFSVAEVAGNIAHEWTHKIGFEHDYKATARRPYSVPYVVGDLVIKLAGLT